MVSTKYGVRFGSAVPILALLFACGSERGGLDATVEPRADATPDAGLPDAVADAGQPDAEERPDGGRPRCPDDPNANSSQQDGECCIFSINCQPGSICNDPVDEFYDPSKPQSVCVKVTCTNDIDCPPPKRCGLERICRDPMCQNDGECRSGTVCVNGACGAAPSVADVASCVIVTPSQSLVAGATVELEAVAKNARGAVLSHFNFDWISSNTNAVSIAGNRATAGAQGGTAQITAAVRGRADVTCTGLRITGLPAGPPPLFRAVVVAEDTGLPIQGAQVTADTGAVQNANTDANGVANFTAQGASVAAVTAVAAGFQIVTVLTPGTSVAFIPLPRRDDVTKAGGFRGVIDISRTRRADVGLGFVGRPLPLSLLDVNRTALFGDSVPTRINAPELGLPNQPVQLLGGLLLSIGNRPLTADFEEAGGGLRCQGVAPGATDLGCEVVRAPGGPSAAWVLAGRVRLSQITALANELFGMMGTPPSGLVDGIAAYGLLFGQLNHGVQAHLQVEEFPKVRVDSAAAVDCTNPTVAADDRRCRGDFARYQRIDLQAEVVAGVLSAVALPDLPPRAVGTGCLDTAVLIESAILPGRGLVPIGISSGRAFVNGGVTTCQIAGARMPFGSTSQQLPNGSVALRAAPLHGGIEGSRLVLLLLAVDHSPPVQGTSPVRALVVHKTSIAEREDLRGLSFLPAPTGMLSRSAATFSFRGATPAGTLTRLEVESPGGRWLIYGPPRTGTLTLPAVAPARTILGAATRASVHRIQAAATYSEMWSPGSGKTLDRLADTLEAFSAEECTSNGACVMQ